MEINKCFYCMEDMSPEEEVCPHCGKRRDEKNQPEFALKTGTILHGRYLVGTVLGQGGFGITYIGYDLLLGIKVSIKEYYPSYMVSRSQSGSVQWSTRGISKEEECNNFLKEADKIAKLMDIPEIVGVQDTVMENDTAYIVMNYVKGITLANRLKQRGLMSEKEVIELLSPIAMALDKVHRYGIIHRNISPDSIMIEQNGNVKLLNLGAAKEIDRRSDRDKQSSQMIHKDGFSPPEQYVTGGNIGPWTDVYAMCATIYYCITGHLVPTGMERLYTATEIPFTDAFSPAVKKALEKGFSAKTADRYQSMGELWKALSGKSEPVTVPKFEALPVTEPVPNPLSETGPALDQGSKTDDKAARKNNKKKLKICIGIFAAVILLAGIIYFVKNYSTSVNTDEGAATETTAATTSETAANTSSTEASSAEETTAEATTEASSAEETTAEATAEASTAEKTTAEATAEASSAEETTAEATTGASTIAETTASAPTTVETAAGTDAGNSSTSVENQLPAPTIQAVINDSNQAEISWSNVNGATNYYVYRKEGENGKWTFLKNVKTLYYTDPSVESGKVYYYAVKAAGGSDEAGEAAEDFQPSCNHQAGQKKIRWTFLSILQVR